MASASGPGPSPAGPVPAGAPPAVSFRGVRKSFGAVRAVDGVDLEVAEGSILGLLGPNGAGKTTLIRVLTTLLPADGEARVLGHDVRREPDAVRRSLGYVPQVVAAEGGLTGRENLALFAALYDVPRRERAARIQDALERAGLAEAADRLAKGYSGGMVRRLEIAQALLHRPRVLVLDEPTVGLDPTARRGVWDNLRRLRAEGGLTVLVTTHSMEEAEALCDRLAILHRGRLVAQGTPAELKAMAGGAAHLDEVFRHFTGDDLEVSGTLQEASRARRTARRLG